MFLKDVVDIQFKLELFLKANTLIVNNNYYFKQYIFCLKGNLIAHLSKEFQTINIELSPLSTVTNQRPSELTSKLLIQLR